ncbi:MAG: GGDEF and EAL domain-containing protein [Actinomycetota bacterium]|nr:GGDEF and EAL domain-containing protein [Actinomycetota bacterium]
MVSPSKSTWSAAADPATPYDDVVRRYRTLVEQLPLVLYIDALDASSSNIFTSRQIEPLLGYTVEEWASDAELFVRTLHPDDRERVLAAHAHTHATHAPLSLEYRLLARDGRIVWVRDEAVIVQDDDGAPLYLQGYLLDVTLERETQAQLREMALFDPLTKLANRAFFQEQFQQAVATRKDGRGETALMFVDLNELKAVNDRWGHDTGDRVLQALGTRIQDSVRAGDSAARLGGDEFAVVLPTVAEPAEAARAAERLLERIRQPIEVDGHQLSVSASIGISIGSDVDVMLKEADAAMYRAKRQQDVGYAFFDAAVDTAAVQRSRRVVELREALERNEFRVDYQPIVDLDAQEITTYEALLRWHHPREGLIAPLDFIPLAEESGLIVPIGTWVLEQACDFGARLMAEGREGISVGVNVSARQLQENDFVKRVADGLHASGFRPDLLTLELTESVLLAAGDQVERQLEQLKSMGVMLALDDFGTGYASLSYLQRFPVDIVKIDRSFTAAIGSPGTDLVLLKGIIDLGTALGLKLVAEGVQTVEQQELVQSLGCHYAQGFYFGYPERIPATKLSPAGELTE